MNIDPNVTKQDFNKLAQQQKIKELLKLKLKYQKKIMI